MTSLQREKASAPFQADPYFDKHPFQLAFLFCVGMAIVIGAGLMAMPS